MVSPLSDRESGSESVNRLANPRAITSAIVSMLLQIYKMVLEEMKRTKNVFFIEYTSDSYQEK